MFRLRDSAFSIFLTVYFYLLAIGGVGVTLGITHIHPSHFIWPIVALLAVVNLSNQSSTVNVNLALIVLAAIFLSGIFTLISSDVGASLFYLTVIVYFSVTCVLVSLLAPYTHTMSLVLVICLGILGAALAGVVTGVWHHGERLTLAIGMNPSWLAGILGGTALFAFWGMAHAGHRGLRVLLIVLGLALFLFLLLTQGRNALLAFLLSLVVGFAISVRGRLTVSNIRWTIMLFLALVVVIVIVLKNFPEYADRIARLWRADAGTATAGRIEVWRAYIDYIIFSGGGFSGLGNAERASGLAPAHNGYITMFVETGPFGPVFVVVLVGAVLVRLARNRETPFVLALWLYPFLLGFGNDIHYYMYFWYSLLLAIYAMFAPVTRENLKARKIAKVTGTRSPSSRIDSGTRVNRDAISRSSRASNGDLCR